MEKIRKFEEFIFYVTLGVIFFVRTLNYTMLPSLVEFSFSKISFIIEGIAVFCLLIKALTDFYCGTKEERITISGFLLLALALYVKTRFFYSVLFVVIAAFKNIKIRRLAILVFIVQIFVLISCGVLSMSGYIPDQPPNLLYRDASTRLAFGTRHANTFGALAFHISLLAMYCWVRKFPLLVTAFNLGLLLLVYVGANSRAATICMLFIVLTGLYFFAKSKIVNLSKAFEKVVVNKSIYIFILTLLLSVLGMLGLFKLEILGSTFSARISAAGDYFYYYPLTLFGGYVSHSGVPGFYLDNGFTAFLLRGGTIAFAFYCLGFYICYRKFEKEYDIINLMILNVCMLHGFMETCIFVLQANFFLLFFADLVWNMPCKSIYVLVRDECRSIESKASFYFKESNKLINSCVLLLLALYLSNEFIDYTTLHNPFSFLVVSKIILIFEIVILLFKFLYQREQIIKLAKYLPFAIVLAFAGKGASFAGLIPQVLLLLCLVDIDYKDILKTFLLIIAPLFIVTVLSSVAMVGRDIPYLPNGVVVHSYGFLYYKYVYAYVFSILLALFLALPIDKEITNANVKKCIMFTPVFFTGVVYVFLYYYREIANSLKAVNFTMPLPLQTMYNCWRNFACNPLGSEFKQILPPAGNSYRLVSGYVDTSYLNVVLTWGGLALIAVIIVQAILVYRTDKLKFSIAAFTTSIASLFYPHMLVFSFNILPLLAVAKVDESSEDASKKFLLRRLLFVLTSILVLVAIIIFCLPYMRTVALGNELNLPHRQWLFYVPMYIALTCYIIICYDVYNTIGNEQWHAPLLNTRFFATTGILGVLLLSFADNTYDVFYKNKAVITQIKEVVRNIDGKDSHIVVEYLPAFIKKSNGKQLFNWRTWEFLANKRLTLVTSNKFEYATLLQKKNFAFSDLGCGYCVYTNEKSVMKMLKKKKYEVVNYYNARLKVNISEIAQDNKIGINMANNKIHMINNKEIILALNKELKNTSYLFTADINILSKLAPEAKVASMMYKDKNKKVIMASTIYEKDLEEDGRGKLTLKVKVPAQGGSLRLKSLHPEGIELCSASYQQINK